VVLDRAVLSFTAVEIHQHVPGQRSGSIFF
jgi:hypothetical protein